MDAERFAWARERVTDDQSREGIGRLGERTLHALLKLYYEPDEHRHEIRVGSFVADICGEDGIVEIQTRQFYKLQHKLAAFLPEHPVTVVYPMPHRKWLIWVDEETGETTPPRRSPKTGKPLEAFYELEKIRTFLTDPNFRLRILLLDLEEYRILNGWSRDKKRGSTRCERLPVALQEEIVLNRPADYLRLLPPELPEVFTSATLAKAGGIRRETAQIALRVLFGMGLVERIGKEGNTLLYRISR